MMTTSYNITSACVEVKFYGTIRSSPHRSHQPVGVVLALDVTFSLGRGPWRAAPAASCSGASRLADGRLTLSVASGGSTACRGRI